MNAWHFFVYHATISRTNKTAHLSEPIHQSANRSKWIPITADALVAMKMRFILPPTSWSRTTTTSQLERIVSRIRLIRAHVSAGCSVRLHVRAVLQVKTHKHYLWSCFKILFLFLPITGSGRTKTVVISLLPTAQPSFMMKTTRRELRKRAMMRAMMRKMRTAFAIRSELLSDEDWSRALCLPIVNRRKSVFWIQPRDWPVSLDGLGTR